MSFTVVRGKKFLCMECGQALKVDYEGGAQMTQIGDFAVMEQQAIAKEFEDVTFNSEVFYLYDFGVCESCFKTKISENMQTKSLKTNALVDSLHTLYLTTYETVNEHFVNALDTVAQDITMAEISKIANGVDVEWLKNNGGKRRNNLKLFLRSYGKNIEEYILSKIWAISDIKDLLEEYTQKSRKMLKGLRELLKDDPGVFIYKYTDASENLNSYIVSDMTIRTPVEGSVSKIFYFEREFCFAEFRREYGKLTDEFTLPKGFVKELILHLIGK